MKRCPQCEFIYEDDQSHCDMDGARLTQASHLLLGSEMMTNHAESSDKPRWRRSFVTLSAPLILLSVLTSFYLVSTEETSSTIPQIVTPALIQTFPATVANPNSPNTESSHSTPAISPGEQNSLNDETDSATTDAEKPEAKPSNNRRRERNAISPTPQSSTRPRSSSGNSSEKEDSKVRSALKKTGRFFKKALPL